MYYKVGGTVNALSLSRDNSKIVVAGRSLLKIFAIDENLPSFKEDLKLYFTRVQGGVSYSDVEWCPNNESVIATASTNGTVAIWDLTVNTRNKQLTTFKDHQRCVTKISFHPTESQKLLSGSQDNSMKIFDLRIKKEASSFSSYGNGVRNVQFSPFNLHQFAASFDNGNVEIWDHRFNKNAILQFIAHERFVYSLEWHPDPDKKNVLATGGSDKMVKVWDVSQYDKKTNDISTTSSVASVRWRPNRPEQLATTALGSTAILDHSVHVWDLRRRFVPFAYFDGHSNALAGIEWKHNDPSVLFSCSNDGFLCMHTMKEASRPGDETETRGFDFSSNGHVCIAERSLNVTTPRSQSPINYKFPSLWTPLKSGSGDFDDIFSTGSAMSVTGNSWKMKQFLNHQSCLKMFSKVPNLMTSCSDISDYLEPENTVLEHLFMSGFRYAARKYILDGHAVEKTFYEVCQHNSDVALTAGMANAGRTWLLLAQFYMNTTDSSLLLSKNANGTMLPRTCSDLTADKGKANGVDMKRSSLSLKPDDSHGSQVFNLPTSGAESEIHSEDGRNELEDYLTVIAKGRQPDFYISDDEAIPSFGYDGGTSEADFLTDQEWGTTPRVPLEAIVQKEVLDTDSIANFGHVDVPLAVANQSVAKRTIYTPHSGRWQETAVAHAEPESSSPSPPADSEADTLTEKDLVVKPSLWPDPLQAIRDQIIYEQIKWFAEINDVQTAVSMLLVLSTFSLLCDVSDDEDLIEHWQLSYLNLLAKHQLWIPHEQVVKLSKVQSIREMSTSSNVQICCKICLRRTPAGTSWSCDRRLDADHANQPASCFFCHLPVTRLYTYCQSCCMGGHLECVEVWMRRKKENACRNHCI